jgi:hypothetical protein
MGLEHLLEEVSGLRVTSDQWVVHERSKGELFVSREAGLHDRLLIEHVRIYEGGDRGREITEGYTGGSHTVHHAIGLHDRPVGEASYLTGIG